MLKLSFSFHGMVKRNSSIRNFKNRTFTHILFDFKIFNIIKHRKNNEASSILQTLYYFQEIVTNYNYLLLKIVLKNLHDFIVGYCGRTLRGRCSYNRSHNRNYF